MDQANFRTQHRGFTSISIEDAGCSGGGCAPDVRQITNNWKLPFVAATGSDIATMYALLESATLKATFNSWRFEVLPRKERDMDTEVRTAGHGSVHAMGIWLATVEYSFVQGAPGDIEAKIYVTNGERDLSSDSIFAEDMILELEDGRRGQMKTLAGNTSNGVYRVRIAGGLSVAPTRGALRRGV